MENLNDSKKELKQKLYVWPDTCSTGLWTIENDLFVCVKLEKYNLPEDLINEFKYWQKWFDDNSSGVENNNFDYSLFKSYGYSIAVNLKSFLKDNYLVFYGNPNEKPMPVEIIHYNSQKNICDKYPKIKN